MVMHIRDDNYLIAFGRHLRQLRKQRRLSQYKLSYDSNISRSQIIAIEKGEINPTICTVLALSKGLGLHPKQLLEFELSDFLTDL